MSNSQYQELEKEIENASTTSDVQRIRTLIQNYNRSKGGTESVVKRVTLLSNLLNVKEREILRSSR